MARKDATGNLEIGAVLEGKVVKITDFGAFVELPNGAGGLVHISELDHSFVRNVRDIVAEEQIVQVKVIGYKNDGKLMLSIKQTKEQPVTERPQRRGHDPGFERMLKSYLKDSEQRLADIRRNRMSKRP